METGNIEYENVHKISTGNINNVETNIQRAELSSLVLAKQNENVSQTTSIWADPWFLSISISTFALVPTLVGSSILAYQLTGRIWPFTIFSLHLLLVQSACYFNVAELNNNKLRQVITSFASLSDLILCGFVYPKIIRLLDFFFVDIDGTIIEEWGGFVIGLHLIKAGLWITVLSRLFLGCLYWISIYSLFVNPNEKLHFPIDKVDAAGKYITNSVYSAFFTRYPRIKQRLVPLFMFGMFLSFTCLVFCIVSCILHFTNLRVWWIGGSANNLQTTCCDDLDPTECALPFPSFHHMVSEKTSRTGWKVELQGFPLLRGGIPVNTSFLRTLDGFSTMAPIVFYLEGLWESHQAKSHGSNPFYYPSLVGDDAKQSITNLSATILWNVETNQTVAHTANMDYLDPTKPLVLVIPAQPLNHSSHYALALLGAKDISGNHLRPSPGMLSLFSDDTNIPDSRCSSDKSRRKRYEDVLLPSLKVAAPWINVDIGTANTTGPPIQIMFDFVTMSEDSLRPIRSVRDATHKYISGKDFLDGDVRTVKIYDNDCKQNDTLVARTIHGSLKVPWWLKEKKRDSTLSLGAIETGTPTTVGEAKFVMHIPCSLRAAAVNDTIRLKKSLRAVVEYGHGLFYNRQESYIHSLLRVAEDQGYIIVAMDWRGMSSFDMPVVIRSLLSAPELFEATRDNLIQGYANKIVLQHLVKDWLIAKSEWLDFNQKRDHSIDRVPLFRGKEPVSVFYGSSEGGVLGAGYTALLGPTGLIHRCILGVPGTSFSVIMSRSDDFDRYDGLLMKNFYNNRDVRIFLSVVQMMFDPVEAAGMLAPPVPHIPRTLLQAGLGDSVIPTIATEALARAYGAHILPNNPRAGIYGIPTSPAANDTWDGPHVSLTEILYTKEYRSLPVNGISGDNDNVVHMCLRQDCKLIAQLAAFVNTGKVTDPCIGDNCIRTEIPCYVYWKRNNTIPGNWTCSYS